MSRNSLRARVRVADLEDELTVGAALRLRKNPDDIRETVAAVVQYLTEEYPSQDLYIPSPTVYPVDAIRHAFHVEQKSVRQVCREFRVSRLTLYRLLSGSE